MFNNNLHHNRKVKFYSKNINNNIQRGISNNIQKDISNSIQKDIKNIFNNIMKENMNLIKNISHSYLMKNNLHICNKWDIRMNKLLSIFSKININDNYVINVYF